MVEGERYVKENEVVIILFHPSHSSKWELYYSGLMTLKPNSIRVQERYSCIISSKELRTNHVATLILPHKC